MGYLMERPEEAQPVTPPMGMGDYMGMFGRGRGKLNIPPRDFILSQFLSKGNRGIKEALKELPEPSLEQYLFDYRINRAAERFRTDPQTIIGETLRRYIPGIGINKPLPRRIEPSEFYPHFFDRWGTPEKWRKDILEQEKREMEKLKELEPLWQQGKYRVVM